jgi:hypothetical protein
MHKVLLTSFWAPARIPSDFFVNFFKVLEHLRESPDPCNGWRGTFTACSGAACACSQRHYRRLVPPLVLAFDRPVQAVEGLRNDRPLRLEQLLPLVGG